MKESALISDRWKILQEKKERKEQFWCAVFGAGFIALLFIGLLLAFVYEG